MEIKLIYYFLYGCFGLTMKQTSSYHRREEKRSRNRSWFVFIWFLRLFDECACFFFFSWATPGHPCSSRSHFCYALAPNSERVQNLIEHARVNILTTCSQYITKSSINQYIIIIKFIIIIIIILYEHTYVYIDSCIEKNNNSHNINNNICIMYVYMYNILYYY